MQIIHSCRWLKFSITLLSLICLLLNPRAAIGQSSKYIINGVVKDAVTGETLPGVLVKIQNSSLATTTLEDGRYSLTATISQGTHNLEFSLLGYKTLRKSVTLGSESTITVNGSLSQDVTGLDEVIVTGASAGTTRKQLGSYVSTVSAEQLNKGASSNILTSLQGKTAGAQIVQNSGDPGGGISVRLRGISSVYSGSEPLYIVDGVIVNNSTTRVTNTSSNYDGGNFVGSIGQNRMADINPSDIERIEVLNGAAAAAIYGSRANAGVIQIFTKRGSLGTPVVNFSTALTISELRKKLDVNQAPTKFGGSPDVQTQDILTPTLTNTTPVTRYDYQDDIFQTGVGSDNNISVSGGSDATKYFASASYFTNEGIIRNTGFTRYGLRFNLDQKIAKWVSFTGGLNYTNSSSKEKPDGNSFFSPMNSVTIIGNFHDIYTRNSVTGTLQAVGERGRVNPLSVIEDIKQRQETNRIIGSAGLKIFPVKNLTIDYTLGIDNYTQNGQTFIPPFPYNVNPDFYGGGPTLNATQNGYTGKASNTVFQINNEVNATYEWNISDEWASTTQLGYSSQYEKTSYSLLQGRGVVVETVNGASTVLPSTDVRGEISISGAYLQENLKYKGHFFVTGAVRFDGSSVFGSENRDQVYLKASASYVLSSADYWKNFGASSWWDVFKLRLAYGQSGNLTGIGAFERFNAYLTTPLLGKSAFYSSTQLANQNIAPERQSELEIGTDMAFLNNRISLQFNWYNKKVNDLLFPVVTAPTTGYSSLLDNVGSMENKGFEMVLNGNPVRKDNFSWNISFIFNRNRNKALGTGALRLLSTNSGAPIAIIEGEPIGVFYGTFFATDANGNLVTNAAGIPQFERGVQNSTLSYTTQRDAAGLPTGAQLRRVIGDPNPDYTSTLVNDFIYKKLSFRFQLDAVQGVDVFNADFRTRQGVGNGKVAEQEHLGILPRGYIAGIYTIEQWRIDDGSFVKLREISLGYNIGKLKFFKDLTVSVSGRNLVSWDDYKGYDPEVNAGGQSTVLRGIDFGAVPIPRTYSIGIQAKF